MKKVFAMLFVAGVMAFTACAPKKTEEAPAAEESAVVDTAATMSADTTAPAVEAPAAE